MPLMLATSLVTALVLPSSPAAPAAQGSGRGAASAVKMMSQDDIKMMIDLEVAKAAGWDITTTPGSMAKPAKFLKDFSCAARAPFALVPPPRCSHGEAERGGSATRTTPPPSPAARANHHELRSAAPAVSPCPSPRRASATRST